MKTAYLGTSEFAATVLRRLADSSHRPSLVVTPPDSKRGRGRKLSPPPAAEVARELGLGLLQTSNVNEPESVDAIRKADAGAVAVCAFGQLIKEPLLSEQEMLNVHPSLVPRWRGAAPIERTIMAGDERTGVSIMKVTEGLDSGPVVVQEEIAVGGTDDYQALSERLAELSGQALINAMNMKEVGELTFTEQDEEESTYAEKIAPEERRLDPSRPAEELARAVRALTPHIGAHLELEDGERLGVRAATVALNGPAAGEIETREGELVLGTADGALRLDLIQPPGGKPMRAADFLRGHSAPTRAI